MLFISSISLVVVSVWAYNVNYKARSVIKNVAKLSGQIKEKEARIKLLKAEWTYLNRPERLNKLVTIHFPELGLVALSHENYSLFNEFLSAGNREASDLTFEPASNSSNLIPKEYQNSE